MEQLEREITEQLSYLLESMLLESMVGPMSAEKMMQIKVRAAEKLLNDSNFQAGVNLQVHAFMEHARDFLKRPKNATPRGELKVLEQPQEEYWMLSCVLPGDTLGSMQSTIIPGCPMAWMNENARGAVVLNLFRLTKDQFEVLINA